MILFLLACAGAPEDSGAAVCATSTLAWEEPGEGLLLEYCDTCHAATSLNRNGAPEGVAFDTVDQVRTHRTRMIAAVEGGRMPPAMPLSTQDERLLLT